MTARTLAVTEPKTVKWRIAHIQFSLDQVPFWWRVKLVLGGSLHLLVRRYGEHLNKLEVAGVKCTLDATKEADAVP